MREGCAKVWISSRNRCTAVISSNCVVSERTFAHPTRIFGMREGFSEKTEAYQVLAAPTRICAKDARRFHSNLLRTSRAARFEGAP
jgi:hypothetical protein